MGSVLAKYRCSFENVVDLCHRHHKERVTISDHVVVWEVSAPILLMMKG